MNKQSRIISFHDYIKPGNFRHIINNLSYTATREGVELNPKEYINQESVPESFSSHEVSPKQESLIQSILKEVPEYRDTPEYMEYKQNANMYTASKFITESMKDLAEQELTNPEYLQYISHRKGVERNDEMNHGLFDATGSADLANIAHELKEHEGKGNVWRDILSLRREDATELDYDHQAAWRRLLQTKMPQLADEMGIPLNDFRWCAAFHDEGYHPHVHIMYWDQTGKHGYLTKKGIENFKSLCANEIFSNEMYLAKQLKTEFRKDIQNEFRDHMDQLYVKAYKALDPSTISNAEDKIIKLSENLPDRGKMQYSYMPEDVKRQVDEIVGDILTDKSFKPILKEYFIQDRKLCEFYKNIEDDFVEKRLQQLIHPQKKDRKVLHNMVLQTAKDLRNAKFEEQFVNRDIYQKTMEAIASKQLKQDLVDEKDQERLTQAVCKITALQGIPSEDTLLYTEGYSSDIQTLEAMLQVKDTTLTQADVSILKKYYDLGNDQETHINDMSGIAVKQLFSNCLNYMCNETADKEREVRRLQNATLESEMQAKLSKIKNSKQTKQ